MARTFFTGHLRVAGRFGGLGRRGRLRRRLSRRLRAFGRGVALLRGQLQEHVFEAHAHRPQLEQPPAAVDDGGGELAADVAAGFALDLEAERAAARFGRRGHARHAVDGGQDARGVGAHRVQLHVHRFRSAQARRQVVGRVHRHDLALVDDHDARARLTDLGQDVGAQNDRVVSAKLLDQLAGLVDLLRVEAGRRLVEDEHLGVVEQRLREADALPVALRELAALAVRHVGHPRALHHRGHARLAFGPRHALDARAEVEIFAHAHVGVERRRLGQIAGAALGLDRFLGEIEAGHDGGALGGRHVAGEHAHGRGLAGAVRAEEAEDFAAFDREADVADGGKGAVPLGEVLDLDHVGRLR
ncbi:MAG TPA: hypothetical protein VIY56_09830 [Vicinamibacterales bacterium]